MLLELAHEEGSFAALRMTVNCKCNANCDGVDNVNRDCGDGYNINRGCYWNCDQ